MVSNLRSWSETSAGSAPYVPDRGDIIWVSLDPQAGREQAGRRPALVLTPRDYNGKTSLALICPITNQAKGYPFEVPLEPGGPIQGIILADHVKSMDWRVRQAEYAGYVSESIIGVVYDRLSALLDG